VPAGPSASKSFLSSQGLRIVTDASSVEVFLEGVPYTFSTRFYPKQHSFIVDAAPEVTTTFWSLSF
jgi:sucrose-6-phosphate hydrolase SacC (GH32 family)